jgi:glyceraldehyde-3-phosphate dehydrogenase type I
LRRGGVRRFLTDSGGRRFLTDSRGRRFHKGYKHMAVKVAINGFGRIGRLVLRAMIESGRSDVEPVAINDLGSVDANAHLFRYDSVHGRFPGEVRVDGDTITIVHNGRTWGPIRVSAERDPLKVPYQGVDVAMECTGLFATKEKAAQLIAAGARRVLISAPADGVDATIVYGVNHATITADMTVISNASCTTNCLAPMASVLHETFGIERGYMVTIHSYTGDQRTVDTLHKDLHRARAAALSMIPTTTGAAKAVGLVLPERVPGVAGCEPEGAARCGGSERGVPASLAGPAGGHHRLQHAAAGQQRFQRRAGQLHLRCHADGVGGQGRADPRGWLVRQ